MELPKPVKKCKNCNLPIKEQLSVLGMSKFCSTNCYYLFKRTSKVSEIKKMDSVDIPKVNKARFAKKLPKDIKLAKSSSLLKELIARDPQYLDFIRDFSCVVNRCTGDIIHAHHTETGGMGIKGSDYSCIPLCNEHHTGGDQSIHILGSKLFQDTHVLVLADIKVRFLTDYIRLLTSC